MDVHTVRREQLKRELDQLLQKGSNCCLREDRNSTEDTYIKNTNNVSH